MHTLCLITSTYLDFIFQHLDYLLNDLFKKKKNKNGNELQKIKRKRKSSPPCWAKSGPCRGRLPSPLAPALPPLDPLAGPLPRTKPPACSPPLSLWQASPTCQSLSLSRSLSLADRPHRSAASSSSRTMHRRPLTTVPSIAVPSPIPSPHRKSSAQPRPRRLTTSLPSTAPAVESHRRRCATLMPALCTSPAPTELHRSPPLERL
jgi:hypothetical protein